MIQLQSHGMYKFLAHQYGPGLEMVGGRGAAATISYPRFFTTKTTLPRNSHGGGAPLGGQSSAFAVPGGD